VGCIITQALQSVLSVTEARLVNTLTSTSTSFASRLRVISALGRYCHGTDRHRWRTPHQSSLTDVHPCQGSTLPYRLAWYGKPQPSLGQPALIYHAGPGLHQLHRPEIPVPPLGIIDRPAWPDHLFQLS